MEEGKETMVPELPGNMNIGDRHASEGTTLQGDYRQRPHNSYETNVKEGMNAAIAKLAVEHERDLAKEVGLDVKLTAKSAVNLLMYYFLNNYSPESKEQYEQVLKLAERAMERVQLSGPRAVKVPVSKLDFGTLTMILPELSIEQDVYNERMARFNEVQRDLKVYRKDRDTFLLQLEGTLEAITSKLSDDDESKGDMEGHIQGSIKKIRDEVLDLEARCRYYILNGGKNPFHAPEAEVIEVDTPEEAIEKIPEDRDERLETTIVVEKPTKTFSETMEKAFPVGGAEAAEEVLSKVGGYVDASNEVIRIEAEVEAVRQMNRAQLRVKAKELGVTGKLKAELVEAIIGALRR